jgi:hypothetical protein
VRVYLSWHWSLVKIAIHLLNALFGWQQVIHVVVCVVRRHLKLVRLPG